MMKARLFFAACCIFSAFTATGQVESFADLKEGDWFTLEYAASYDSVQGDFWRSEKIRNIEFKGTVVKKSKGTLTLSFKPGRFYENILGYGDRFLFYDSYFPNLNKKSPTQFREYPQSDAHDYTEAQTDDSLTVEIDLHSGVLKDTVYNLSHQMWLYKSQVSGPGIRTAWSTSYFPTIGDRRYFEKPIFHNAVLSYLYQWADNSAKGKPMPGTVLPDKNIIPGFTFDRKELAGFIELAIKAVRISGASFDLPPNTSFTYKCKNSLSEKQLTLRLKYKDIRLKQEPNGTVRARFFLPAPEKVVFDDAVLLLSPGDSLFFEKDQSGTFSFSGRGAAACRYEQDRRHTMRMYRDGFDYFVGAPSKADFDRRLRKLDSIYHKLWNDHENGMGKYWLTSSQLSYKYWYAAVYLSAFATWQSNRHVEGPSDNEIPWKSEPFTEIAPYVDYRYRPDGYKNFWKTYYRFKILQLGNDNLTLTPNYPWNKADFETYYLQQQLFAGYPKSYLMSETLKSIMQNMHLSSCEREHDNFVQSCNDPELRGEITTLHRQLMQLEPGANIRDLNPEMAKIPFLKDKADGYILLNTRYKGFEWDRSWTSKLREALQKNDLTDRVKIVALRPKEAREMLPDSLKSPNKYLYVDNARLKVPVDFLDFFENGFILLRNDGTIVSREFSSSETGFGKLNYLIKADTAARAEKSGQTLKSILRILAIVLITGIVVAAIARIRIGIVRKREKRKRMIAELELKAIRSQMNPHFIFNALGSIQNLINKGKSDEADRYLINFAKLLRMVLSSSEKKLVPLSDEIEQLRLYLELERMRVPFEYDIGADAGVHPDNEEIPGMLLQPIVENAVIHGIVPKQGGRISVRIRKENNMLLAEITDTGNGFSDKAAIGNGFGLRAINERLKLLNDELKTDISLKTENLREGETVIGARVTISVPV